MKTILVAIDFSAASLNAANYAADMAAVIKADLLLVHIYPLPVYQGDVTVGIDTDEERQACQGKLIGVKEGLLKRTNGKLNIETMVRVGMYFYEQLAKVCEETDPYIVIMGSQGTTASERFLFGSHTVYAMKHLSWPIITIPPEAHFSSIKKIGLACDFENLGDTLPVDEIKLLVNDFNAELHILNVRKQEDLKPETESQFALLQKMLEPLKPEYHFVINKHTDNGIIDFAERAHLDLLIVVPKRHGLTGMLTHKSHTKHLVLHSHTPLVEIHL